MIRPAGLLASKITVSKICGTISSKVPGPVKEFQEAYPNLVVLASQKRLDSLKNSHFLGMQGTKLRKYLAAVVKKHEWSNGDGVYEKMTKDGLTFGQFYMATAVEGKQELVTFFAERHLIETLEAEFRRNKRPIMINVIYQGKQRMVIFKRFKTSYHDWRETYEEQALAAKPTSTRWKSEAPGRRHPFVHPGMQIKGTSVKKG
ncbi:hypothetical protein ACFLZ2_00910 [Candidatus Margulisiibacteriota bacterium]